jgi:hypothetical protein
MDQLLLALSALSPEPADPDEEIAAFALGCFYFPAYSLPEQPHDRGLGPLEALQEQSKVQ